MFEFLSAKRSWCNESEAKNMAGCVAKDGIVWCFVSTEKKGEEIARLLNQTNPR